MDSTSPNHLQFFRKAFEALGYRPFKELPIFEFGDQWYKHDLSTDLVTHVAFLEYKPSGKAYVIKVGASNPDAMRLLTDSLPVIRKYVRPEYISGGGWLDVSNRPCWTLFDCGRSQDWESLYIPDPIDRSSWPTMLDKLVNSFLRPVLWSIKNPQGVQNLLLSDEKPFEWWATPIGVFRAAEIIALSQITNTDREVILGKLSEHKNKIVRDMYGVKDYEGMIEELFKDG
jgi:hypothetical protein